MTPASLSPATPSELQHQLAELVGGRDRRRVEAGQRVPQVAVPRRTLVVRALEQVRHHLVVADQRGVVESLERVDNLIADPLPQLLAGGAAERDEQHLSSVAAPSATYRVTSPASANVLPVPALASSTVVEFATGSGPSRSKRSITPILSARSSGSHTRVGVRGQDARSTRSDQVGTAAPCAYVCRRLVLGGVAVAGLPPLAAPPVRGRRRYDAPPPTRRTS